jgi:hypothetical protein
MKFVLFVSLEIQYNYFLALRLEKLVSNSIGKSPQGAEGSRCSFSSASNRAGLIKASLYNIHTDGKQEHGGIE